MADEKYKDQYSILATESQNTDLMNKYNEFIFEEPINIGHLALAYKILLKR